MFMDMFPVVSTSIDPSLFEQEALPALPAAIAEAIICTAIGVVIYEVFEIVFEKL